MVCVYAGDEDNFIELTEGYIPPLSELHKYLPQYYKKFADIKPNNPEEAVAWMFTTYAQKILSWRLAPRLKSLLPIQTWLIGPPKNKDGELAAWFENEPSNTNYRIFIHRQPQYHEGHRIQGQCFEKPHTKLPIRHRTGKFAHLKRVSEPLLEDVVKAYREGHEAVEARITQTNHLYAFSGGFISS